MRRCLGIAFLVCWAGCGSPPRNGQLTPLFSAVRQGDFDQVRRLVEEEPGQDAALFPGFTPWHYARIRGYEEIASYLQSHGVATGDPMPPPETLAEWRWSRLARPDLPATAALVARGGQVLFANATGLANIEEGTPASLQTRFRIGSVTKQFTAAAILRLQERGELGLTDPLSKYFPGLPNADTITLHHLLTHTSGLHSYTSKADFMKRVTQPVTAEEVIAYFETDEPEFEPGLRWSYCNSGYFLLGEIVARVSGTDYATFVGRELLAPLEMAATSVAQGAKPGKGEALGYTVKDGVAKPATAWNMSWAGGAGALVSTVDDLLKWNNGLFGGRVLNEANFELMLTPVEVAQDVEPGPKETGYGYGLGIGKERGVRVVRHSGGLNGFSSVLLYVPEEKLTVVVLAAWLPGPNGEEVDDIARELLEFYLWEKMDARPVFQLDTSVDPSDFERFAGRYDYGGSSVLSVVVRDDRIFAQLTGQPEYEIFPRSATEFYWKVAEATLAFTTNETGAVTGGIHRQGGAETVVPKLPETETLTLSAETLDSFVGQYDYGGGAVLTVTREGDRLFAQLTGQLRAEIVASSETRFRWRVVDAAITFVRNPAGDVIKGIHEQGGRQFDVPKIK